MDYTGIMITFFNEVFWFFVFAIFFDYFFLGGKITEAITSRIKKENPETEGIIKEMKERIDSLEKEIEDCKESIDYQNEKINALKNKNVQNDIKEKIQNL